MSTSDEHLISRRVNDLLYIVVVALLVGWMVVISVFMYYSTQKLGELNHSQLDAITLQNDSQICTQHDIIIVVRGIARKLGLPTDDIIVPDITGLDCPKT